MPKVVDKKLVVMFREAGGTIKDIAAKVGCSERNVSYILKQAGVSTSAPRAIIDREALTAAWQEPVALPELALRFGCSAATVSKIAKSYGLPRKSAPPKAVETDPTPAEIEERKAEIKRRHLEEKRRETDDTTRIRVWRQSVASGVA